MSFAWRCDYLCLTQDKVESIGEGVTNVAVGDHVIPLYTAGAYREFILHIEINHIIL